MMRKLLIIAAAVAMPASALAAVTAVGSSGVAGAAGKTYTSMSCTVTGTVTFAKPGLSYDGSLSAASVSKAKSSATATGTACGKKTTTDPSGTVNTTKDTITTPSTNCNTSSSPPPVCSKETATKFYAYDTASSLASSGVSSIVSSLGPTGIKLVDNYNAVTGDVTESGTSAIDPGGACGAANVGFELQGNTNITNLTYNLVLCIVGDTGTNTTGSFYTDYLDASGGDTLITIATGSFSGNSELSFTFS
jgi:hypothetical protein